MNEEYQRCLKLRACERHRGVRCGCAVCSGVPHRLAEEGRQVYVS